MLPNMIDLPIKVMDGLPYSNIPQQNTQPDPRNNVNLVIWSSITLLKTELTIRSSKDQCGFSPWGLYYIKTVKNTTEHTTRSKKQCGFSSLMLSYTVKIRNNYKIQRNNVYLVLGAYLTSKTVKNITEHTIRSKEQCGFSPWGLSYIKNC